MNAFSISSFYNDTFNHHTSTLVSDHEMNYSLRIPLYVASSIPKASLNSDLTNTKTTKNKQISITNEALTSNNISSHLLNTPAISQFSEFLTTVSKSFTQIFNPPLHPYVDSKHVLVGNFAPVNELPPTECLILEGELPSSLNGVYIRNGPNPQYRSNGPQLFFEGDGMLHSLQISNGKATFCSRYVKTYKYNLENDVGFPIFPNILSGFYSVTDIARCAIAFARVIAGQINPRKGFGLANTSLSFFSNELFAHCESDLPYAIRLTPQGDIETIGRYDFSGNTPFINMTAHPKIDPDTGKAYVFRCNPFRPYLTFFHFDQDGSRHPDVPIFSMQSPALIHDFGITKNYAIFVENQIEMDLMKIIMCKGMPLGYKMNKVPRVGIIPKEASDESQITWFPIEEFNPLHVINAWEEKDDEVVLIAPNAVTFDNLFGQMEKAHFCVEKVRINVKTGRISRTKLSERNLELGSINPSFVGKKNRYAYMGVGENIPKMSGVVKIDLDSERVVASKVYEQGCFAGEPLFVARDVDDFECDEDDGYLVSYVHNENTGESMFLVMDAKSTSLETVASVKLPSRVPYGFHGLFVKEKDILRGKKDILRGKKDNTKL